MDELEKLRKQLVDGIKLKTIKIGDIKPHPRNTKIHPESQIGQLMESFVQFGYANPVAVTKDNLLIYGHGRMAGLKQKGITDDDEITVIELDFNEDQALAYNVADNKLQENSLWDIPQLSDVLGELQTKGFNLNVIGFTDEELLDLDPNGEVDFGLDEIDADEFLEDEFAEIDEDELKTDYECPKCGYEWSGQAKPIQKR
jgi:ParB-like chromosome segregation protein Spo0J